MPYRNAPVHPFLRFIYVLLRIVTRAAMGVFYRRRLVLGRGYARFDGPAIVVCNHPSTLMDPLNVGLQIRQEMYFLANYGLFKHPVSNWLLSRLFCIPVKRREDVPEGEARDNDAAFEASFQHLGKNGVLFVAAEGVSWMNRFVRPFKTGTARIAFGAEKRNNWELGVKIIPVGLSYDAPRLFRSRVTIEFGAPVDPRPWAAAEAGNHEQAVEDFTASIQARVRTLTLDGGSEAGDLFVQQAETLMENAGQPLPASQRFFALKHFLNKYRENEPEKMRFAHYFKQLEQHRLDDAGFEKHRSTPLDLLWLPAGAPFFVCGWLCWFLPCFLPGLLCKKMNIYPGYDSNIKMLTGLFSFPLALWGGWELVFALTQSIALAWAFLPAFFVLGFAAESWQDTWRNWRAQQKVKQFSRNNPENYLSLTTQRQTLIQHLLEDTEKPA
jgi:1-acyl-sn-glycerol-3-phosphate acyltransferase